MMDVGRALEDRYRTAIRMLEAPQLWSRSGRFLKDDGSTEEMVGVEGTPWDAMEGLLKRTALMMLGTAPLYVVSDEIHELVTAAAETMPEAGVDVSIMAPRPDGVAFAPRSILDVSVKTSETADPTPVAAPVVAWFTLEDGRVWLVVMAYTLSIPVPVGIEAPKTGQLGPFARYLVALGEVSRQRISSSRLGSVPRGTRRRLPVEYAPSLNVLHLRQPRRAGGGAETSRDWASRWIVRSHWRQQWYPSLNRHQPKLISAYVKGPEDKPLRVRPLLVAVDR